MCRAGGPCGGTSLTSALNQLQLQFFVLEIADKSQKLDSAGQREKEPL